MMEENEVVMDAEEKEQSEVVKVDLSQYIEGLKATREEMLTIVEKAKISQAILEEIAKESGVQFPYKWDVEEVGRLASSYIQQVDVDIEAFSKKAEEENSTEEEPEVTTPDEVKSLKELVEKL